jgi:hypothetical protein
MQIGSRAVMQGYLALLLPVILLLARRRDNDILNGHKKAQ